MGMERLVTLMMALCNHQRLTLEVPVVFSGDGGGDTKEERRLVLFYVDNVAISAKSEEDAMDRLRTWETGMEKRGLKINIRRTKVMVKGKPLE